MKNDNIYKLIDDPQGCLNQNDADNLQQEILDFAKKSLTAIKYDYNILYSLKVYSDKDKNHKNHKEIRHKIVGIFMMINVYLMSQLHPDAAQLNSTNKEYLKEFVRYLKALHSSILLDENGNELHTDAMTANYKQSMKTLVALKICYKRQVQPFSKLHRNLKPIIVHMCNNVELPSCFDDLHKALTNYTDKLYSDLVKPLSRQSGSKDYLFSGLISVLRYAVDLKYTEALKIMLYAGCYNRSHLLEGNNNYTLLHYAANSGDSEVVKTVLDAAGNDAFEMLGMQEYDNLYTPLYLAARSYDYETESHNTEALKLMLEVAGDNASELLGIQNENGETPLYCVAERGNTEALKLMLDAAGDNALELLRIRTREDCYTTPLHLAAHSGNCEALELMLSAAGDSVLELLEMLDDFNFNQYDEGVTSFLQDRLKAAEREAEERTVTVKRLTKRTKTGTAKDLSTMVYHSTAAVSEEETTNSSDISEEVVAGVLANEMAKQSESESEKSV